MPPCPTAPIYSPGPTPATVLAPDGQVLAVPPGWVLLPPGEPGLTRRVKADGAHWVVQERRGRKTFARGVWADAAANDRIRADLAAERTDPSYARRQAAAAGRRERVQGAYVADFAAAVRSFLAFHPAHASLADRLARAVTEHATPVGSGTVARTERIPIDQRAEAAVIAWMRHRTTAYDSMAIARVKGERREVRRHLAARSHELLRRYRRGDSAPEVCPLGAALARDDCPRQATGPASQESFFAESSRNNEVPR